MTPSQTGIYRSLRLAGGVLLLGLFVEIVSLMWNKPLSFLLFAGVAGLATFAGVCAYLYSLIPETEPPHVGITKN